MTHPLDEALAEPAAANADHALETLRRLARPITNLDLKTITEWARRQRAGRLAAR